MKRLNKQKYRAYGNPFPRPPIRKIDRHPEFSQVMIRNKKER